MSAALSLVTFEDLVGKITELHDRARADKSRDGWERLLDVARSLAGGADAEDDPSAVGLWYLAEVQISGYQGIGDHQPFTARVRRQSRARVVTATRGSDILLVTIVKRTDKTPGFTVLPRRWVVERTFGWLTCHRRLVRNYERRPEHHEAMVWWATIAIMTRRLRRELADGPPPPRWGQPGPSRPTEPAT